MGGYGRNEYEDWDEYEEDGEEEEVEEDGYEETHQPTQEELEYLQLRQKLKESFRKRMKKELGTANVGARDKTNGFRNDNYGNFFGPSQPVISARVIQESKSLLENPDLAARISKPNRPINKSSVSDSAKSKSRDIHPPRVTNGLKRKAECLKNTRDYSFLLSDDYEVPASSKVLPPPRNVSATKTGNSYRVFGGLEDARSAQPQPRSNNNNRHVVNDRDRGRESASNGHQRDRGRESASNGHHLNRERESASNGNHRDVRKRMPPSNQNKNKVGQERVAPVRSKSSIEPRKQLGINHGSGPGRLVGPKGVAPNRTSVPASTGKSNPYVAKTSTSGASKPTPSSMQSALRRPVPSLSQSSSHKPIPSRGGQPSGLRKPLMQKDYRESSNKPKVVPKQAVASSRDHQLRRPQPKPAARHSLSEERPQAKPRRPLRDEASDDDNAISMIRQMFKYNPKKYRDDDDDSDMEANFEDIMREEKRSAKIARQEDEEQMRLIEEEEKRERMRQAKKHKLGH